MTIAHFEPVGLICFGTFFLIGILGTIFWIWALVDCVKNEPSEGNDKLIWILIIVLTHWIGALIYYFVRVPQRTPDLGR
ncbi:MAG TPA: PLD nuclease N-terminal domain-containing protein [Planctomycetota bacterium]|nr:PLD nuclease N-terminal domain-containing protein [Planctomycetota bacterium]